MSSLQAAGHEARLVGDADALRRELPGSQVLIIDLTVDAAERIGVAVEAARSAGARTLAFYSHVEADVRSQAEAAGIDMVVPRSRMAREGVVLVDRLSGPATA